MAARGSLWLIYALGGGWGHVTRAAALARAAYPQRAVRILTNSPYASQVRLAMPELDLIVLDPAMPAARAREQTIRHIRAAAPACLIVDTFPRGLGGELAQTLDSLAPTKVLVHRDLNPRYVAEAGLRAFVESAYDLILSAGEGSTFAATVTAPWVLRSPDELLPRHRARRVLRLDNDRQHSILVCAAGTAEEQAWYGAAVSGVRAMHSKAAVRCIAPACPPGCPPECWINHWPAADLFNAADVVIGGAGYNTVHECLAYQVPLIARPWPRKYDRQWLRARRAAKSGAVIVVEQPAEAAAAVRQLGRVQWRNREFRNGATEAVALIDRVQSRHE
jgi:hypothetical protein